MSVRLSYDNPEILHQLYRGYRAAAPLPLAPPVVAEIGPVSAHPGSGQSRALLFQSGAACNGDRECRPGLIMQTGRLFVPHLAATHTNFIAKPPPPRYASKEDSERSGSLAGGDIPKIDFQSPSTRGIETTFMRPAETIYFCPCSSTCAFLACSAKSRA